MRATTPSGETTAPPPRGPSSGSARRRAVLQGLAAAGGASLLAACTLDDAVEGLLDRPAGTADEPAPDADAEVLAEALALVDALLLLVRATAREQASLRTDLAPLAAVHDAHRSLLAEGVPGSGPPDASRRFVLPRSAAGALRLVRAQEEEGARLLGELADRVEGGQLARLLAVVTASLAQHLAVLPRRPGGPPARRLVPTRPDRGDTP